MHAGIKPGDALLLEEQSFAKKSTRNRLFFGLKGDAEHPSVEIAVISHVYFLFEFVLGWFMMRGSSLNSTHLFLGYIIV